MTMIMKQRPQLRLLPVLIVVVSITVILLFGTTTSSFSIVQQRHSTVTRRQSTLLVVASSASSSSSEDNDDTSTASSSLKITPIKISGHNVALTSSLVEYVNKRIGNILDKLVTSTTTTEVVLSLNRNPKVKNGHRVEIVTNLKGTTIICKNESPDMYTSIDMSASALQRKLVQYKERRTMGYHGSTSTGSVTNEDDADADFALALEESINVNSKNAVDGNNNDMDDIDDEANSTTGSTSSNEVVPIRSFQLNTAISIEEAIFALDYVDHDFYVFRNALTNDINVVYKRHHGGIGHIEP